MVGSQVGEIWKGSHCAAVVGDDIHLQQDETVLSPGQSLLVLLQRLIATFEA